MLLTIALSSVADQKPPAEQRYAAAAAYLDSKNGHAMLVYEKGELVFEKYLNGWKADRAHRLASGTKSFSGAMAVAAVMDGYLNLDEKVSDTITEWKTDERRSLITVRQLLQLNSGIEPGPNGKVPSYKEAIQVKAIDDAGNKFRYGPNAFMVFGELMKRKLEGKHGSALAYLEERIFKPIGLKHGIWRKDVDGNPHLPSGAFITAKEWAKFGLLIQNQGKWNGKQILDSSLLKQCFQPAKAQPLYGITFWLGRGDDTPKDLVMAAGAGKQKLYICPSKELLIVQLAEAKGYKENEFIKLALAGFEGKVIAPAKRPQSTTSNRPTPGNGNRLQTLFNQMDRNKDGKIEKSEASRMNRFDQLDGNQDGFLTMEEIMGRLLPNQR